MPGASKTIAVAMPASSVTKKARLISRTASRHCSPSSARQKTGRPLYCGEFGCRLVTPEPARTRWYRDLVSVFDELDMAFANWDYRGNFGLVDADGRDTGTAALLLGTA